MAKKKQPKHKLDDTMVIAVMVVSAICILILFSNYFTVTGKAYASVVPNNVGVISLTNKATINSLQGKITEANPILVQGKTKGNIICGMEKSTCLFAYEGAMLKRCSDKIQGKVSAVCTDISRVIAEVPDVKVSSGEEVEAPAGNGEEDCASPGDEDGNGVEGCEDPDCEVGAICYLPGIDQFPCMESTCQIKNNQKLCLGGPLSPPDPILGSSCCNPSETYYNTELGYITPYSCDNNNPCSSGTNFACSVSLSTATEICANGVDDDNNGDIDCDDSACPVSNNEGTPSSTCDDGYDNDCDGDTDCYDEGCIDTQNCLNQECITKNDCETKEICEGVVFSGNLMGSKCISNVLKEEACIDGKDNDDDGSIDCADQDCVLKLAMSSTVICENGIAKEVDCDDGYDNDNNGKTDGADTDCQTIDCYWYTCQLPQCDGEFVGIINDYGGTQLGAICENLLPKELDCTDGMSNDGANDGADCADTDCYGKDDCENPETSCEDDFDNDGDGDTDCDDGDCKITLKEACCSPSEFFTETCCCEDEEQICLYGTCIYGE
jgi:hypothetical protein